MTTSNTKLFLNMFRDKKILSQLLQDKQNLFCDLASKNNLFLPLQRDLEQQQLHATIHHSLLVNSCVEAEKAFRTREIECVRLKGLAIFPEPTSELYRSMSDIDLWVPPAQFENASFLLQELGYQKQPTKIWEASKNRTNFFKINPQGVRIDIDLHQKLFWKEPQGFPWRVQPIGGRYNVLYPEDHFFYRTLSWLYQDGGVDIYKIIDLYKIYLDNQKSWDWDRVLYLGHLAHLRHIIELSITLLDKIYDLDLDVPINRQISQKAANFIESDFFFSPKQKPFSYYLWRHWLRQNWRSAIEYDLKWLWAYKGHILTRLLSR